MRPENQEKPEPGAPGPFGPLKTAGSSFFLPFWLLEQPRLPSGTGRVLPRLGGQNHSAGQGD